MSEYMARLQEAIASSICGMSQEDMLRAPAGKWSTAEILEHLYLSYTGTVKGCERNLSAERLTFPTQSLSQRLKTLVIVTLGYFPRRGIKAPPGVVPKGAAVEQVVADISDQIKKMEQGIIACESRYGSDAKLLKHPVLGGLTAGQWRKFHWVHGRHHVRQIREMRKEYARKEKASGTPEA